MSLEIRNLTIEYGAPERGVRAVDGVTLSVLQGECFGLIGESGCGKTTLALAILNLLPSGARRVAGALSLAGQDHDDLSPEEWRRRRWTDIAYVPQGAINAFDPVSSLFRQFEITARAHGGLGDLRGKAEDLFRQVGLEPAWLDHYPHQLSGGMRQRAAIALALLFDPGILVADEPTTGLDVLVQREVLELLQRLQRERRMTLLLVSHDLGVVSALCQAIAVMYAGRIVETGAIEDVLGQPTHPYTMGVRLAFGDVAHPDRFPIGIPGSLPAGKFDNSCPFAPRCPFALDLCSAQRPELEAAGGRLVACHRKHEAMQLRSASRKQEIWEQAVARR